ncbi:MAG: cation:proton antiporter [Planctomycetota bacterium]
METPFLLLLLIALGASASIWAFRLIGLSPLLGYLAFGVALSPFREVLFDDPHVVEVVAESGVILLMFFIGLEFHLDKIRDLWKTGLLGGSIQMILSGAAAFGAARLFGLGWLPAAMAGLVVAFSSTAVVMRLLEERGESDTLRGRASIGVLLTQDVIAVLALAVLPLFSAEAQIQGAGGFALRLAALAVALPALFLLVRWGFPKLFLRAAAARSPELLTWLSFAACFATALAAHVAGGSFAVGAFMGGLVLSRSPVAPQIRAELNTLRNGALGFFFISVGWLVDLGAVAADPLPVLGLFAGLVVMKGLTAGLAMAAMGLPLRMAAAVGLTLAQIGEFSLVVGQVCFGLGLIDSATLGAILPAAILSMGITPFLFPLAARMARSVPGKGTATESSGPAPGAVVVGHGPVGRTVTRILRDFGVPPVVIDLNLATVKALEAAGQPAVYGDGRRREVLSKAGAGAASFVVVTLPDLESRLGVVTTARSLNPETKILTRARYMNEKDRLAGAGADLVRFEECEVAAALAEHLLQSRGLPPDRILEELEVIRCSFESGEE